MIAGWFISRFQLPHTSITLFITGATGMCHQYQYQAWFRSTIHTYVVSEGADGNSIRHISWCLWADCQVCFDGIYQLSVMPKRNVKCVFIYARPMDIWIYDIHIYIHDYKRVLEKGKWINLYHFLISNDFCYSIKSNEMIQFKLMSAFGGNFTLTSYW